MTILDTISRLFSIYIHITPDLIRYTLTTIYYTSCQQISGCYNYECKVIHKEFIYSNQIGSFLTILDTISRLSSIYIHIAPNLIRYTLITIYYPSCQQISVCYNYECKVIHKEFIYSNQIGSFLTILDTISRLFSIYIHITPNLIRYTLTTIYYPSCQQISVCYNSRVQAYSQRIYIQQSNWVIFDHFGHYFQIIFNLYSYYTKFNSIHINYYILSILSTNFSLL